MRTIARLDNSHERLVDAGHCHHDAEQVNLAAAHPHHEGHESHSLQLPSRTAIQRLRLLQLVARVGYMSFLLSSHRPYLLSELQLLYRLSPAGAGHLQGQHDLRPTQTSREVINSPFRTKSRAVAV